MLIPIQSRMPLAIKPSDPKLAIAGATDELQFNIALGHEDQVLGHPQDSHIRAGLALSFLQRDSPKSTPNANKHRIPPVWIRLNDLAEQFPNPIMSLVWDGPRLDTWPHFVAIDPNPRAVFYFSGRHFPWQDNPQAIATLAATIVQYFDQLMSIYEAVYDDQAYHQFMNMRRLEMFNRLAQLIQQFVQIILQGAPGTGKTFLAKQLCAHLIGLRPEAGTDKDDQDHEPFVIHQGQRWDIVQFHPAYNYEDFVRGIQVSTQNHQDQVPDVRYDTVHRVFSDICARALAALQENEVNPPKFILIIDEINRANLAAVLGELIYALEYRGESIRTPYDVGNDGYNLTVPRNLYVIGTMNTADRSIGHIDYAVRRRFAFVSMLPDRNIVFNHYPRTQQLRDSALALFDAVAALFNGENGSLSREFHADDVQPGHTYFLADNNLEPAEACRQLVLKFVYQVIPLLREYVKDGVLTHPRNVDPNTVWGMNVQGVDVPLSEPVPRDRDIFGELEAALCAGLPNEGNNPEALAAAGAGGQDPAVPADPPGEDREAG